MNVRNLEVRLRTDTVVVSARGHGRDEGAYGVPLDDPELQAAFGRYQGMIESGRGVERIQAGERPRSASNEAEKLGATLFDAVFSGRRRSILERCRSPQGQWLRIVIEIDPRVENRRFFAALPWELMYSSEEQRFLALQRATPVLRHIPVSVARHRAPRAGRLRILAIAAQPYDSTPLDLTTELQALRRLDRRLGIRVTVLEGEDAQLHRVHQALAADRPHVVHFMGHCSFDPACGLGDVHLVDPNGQIRRVPGPEMASILGDVDTLRLVVVNACDTARMAEKVDSRPLAGVASAAVLAGIPVVVAMQRKISDRAAVAFATELYARIEQSEPIDLAVTRARQKVKTLIASVEWSTPTVFVGEPDRLEVFRPSLLRRTIIAAAVLAAGVILASTLGRIPSRETSFDLAVQVSRLRFVLARDQPLFERLRVEMFSARDIAAAILPGATSLIAPDTHRLDVQVAEARAVLESSASTAGSVTLQPTTLPGGTSVVIETFEGHPDQLRPDRLRLVLDGAEQPLTVALDGSIALRFGRDPWRRLDLARPRLARVEPRSRGLDLGLDLGDSGSVLLRTALDVSDIGFLRLEEIESVERTEVEEVSTIVSGRLDRGIGLPTIVLGAGDVLRVTLVSGHLYRMRLGPNGIELGVRGRARALSRHRPGIGTKALMPSQLARTVAEYPYLVFGTVALLLVVALALAHDRSRFFRSLMVQKRRL